MYKKALKFCIKWFAIFFVVSVIAFMCPRLMPGNPAQSLLEAYQMAPTEENIALDLRPDFFHFFHWLFRLLFLLLYWGSFSGSDLGLSGFLQVMGKYVC